MLIKFSREAFKGTEAEYEDWLRVVADGDAELLQAFASEVSPPAAFEMCHHLIDTHPRLTPPLREANKAYIRAILDQIPDHF